MKGSFLFKEEHSPSTALLMGAKLLYSTESRYQRIEVFENEFFGKVLVLDGYVMLTERDEWVYHEMLVHPAMTIHPAPKEVLVIGGGDGGSLREVLKYSEVVKAVQVELDQTVSEVSKKFFPTLSSGFSDPRALLLYEDGAEFVRRAPDESYDVIIVDSPDPVGPAERLFTGEFYRDLHRVLASPGVLVVQSESPWYHLEVLKKIHNALRELFGNAHVYTAPIPSYPGGWWSFTLCLKGIEGLEPTREAPDGLKFYSHKVFRGALELPLFLRKALE